MAKVIYTPLDLTRCYVNRLLVTMVNLCKECKLPNYRHLLSSSSSLPAWRCWQTELTRTYWQLRIVRSRRAPEKLQSTWPALCMAFLRWPKMTRVAWKINRFLACRSRPNGRSKRVFLYWLYRYSRDCVELLRNTPQVRRWYRAGMGYSDIFMLNISD